MRGISIIIAIIATCIAVAGGVYAEGRLPTSIDRDVVEMMGRSLLEDSSSDSITVVPHNYFTPSETDSRSLLSAADAIRSQLSSEMEEATYRDIPSMRGHMVTPRYTTDLDPALLLETAAVPEQHQSTDSFVQTLAQELALEQAERQARERIEEMNIGLIEQQAALRQAPTNGKAPTWVAPAYKVDQPVAPKPTPSTPAVRSAVYQTPEYKPVPTAHPSVRIAQIRAARRAARRAHRKATEWSVAPIIPRGDMPKLSHEAKHAARKARRAARKAAKKAYITPAMKPEPKKRHSRRACIKRDAKTNKCIQRCARCTKKATKKTIQYMSPSFYVPQPTPPPVRRVIALPRRRIVTFAAPAFFQPQPQPPKRVIRYAAPAFYPRKPVAPPTRRVPDGQRVLVNTPAGPVYVMYVTKKGKKVTPPSTPRQLAFHQSPRSIVRTAGGTYVLPHAPISPYRLAAQSPIVAVAARRLRQAARKQARLAASRQRAQLALAQARQQYADFARLRKQQIRNTQYDPKSNTIIRHIQNHHFERVAPSVPTLRRAYIKLCRLQRAILSKYNNSARRAVAARHITAPRPVPRIGVNVVAKAATLGGKYDPAQVEASALRKKYSAHLKRYRHAKKLIRRAQSWLRKRRAERAAEHARQVHCRLLNHTNGGIVPSQCHAPRVTRRQRTRTLMKIRLAKKKCRALAREAGVAIPSQCVSHRKSQAVFRKNRYDPITNRVRFAQQQTESTTQQQAETETEAETQTETQAENEAQTETESETAAEAETEAETETKVDSTSETEAESESSSTEGKVEGLDYNQSPLMKKLLAQLKAKNII